MTCSLEALLERVAEHSSREREGSILKRSFEKVKGLEGPCPVTGAQWSLELVYSYVLQIA